MPLLFVKMNWKLNNAPSLKLNSTDEFNPKLRIDTLLDGRQHLHVPSLEIKSELKVSSRMKIRL